MWLASSLAKPDPAYEHIVADSEFRDFGPGPVAQWPMLHDELYICRLSDMTHAVKLRDAYEVGFRGRKREMSTASTIKLLKEEGKPLDMHKNVGYGPLEKISTVSCDSCGEVLSGLEGDDRFLPGSFYYCKRCKRNGNRYELCAHCHAVECSQGVGKHLRADPHPHFLQCRHADVEQKRLLSGIDTAVPDIRRVFCDYCGQLAGHCDTDDEIWTCPRCPGTNGVRFELCGPCRQDLEARGATEKVDIWDRFNPLAALGR